jgi:hypothetical protein
MVIEIHTSHSSVKRVLAVPASPLETHHLGDGPMSVMAWGTLPSPLFVGRSARERTLPSHRVWARVIGG